AFRIPNLLRDMVAEGAVNAAFVPVFSEYAAKKSKEEFWHLANCVVNILLVILAALTILGVVFSPWIVRLIAPGFSADALKFQETVRLTRVIYPYLLLIALSAYCMGVLNSLKSFTISALAPCFLNISIIVFAVIYKETTLGLALGVLAGGVLQLAIQIPMLYKKGFRYSTAIELHHPGIRQIRKLILPRIFSSCIYQLNLFVDTILGSLAHIVGQGAISALYFANRIFQFPLGIFGIAIAQAALPSLSHQALEDNLDNFKKTLNFSLIAVFLIMLPVSA
ncbi:MAG TPA: murein biosynthesis integral membrane protein MurJ, partial [Candidatus Omnitrophica bacterium]|nr:murein biosynthesis integral membrane protein MurJ [Candidatus Omnitrophota bacterium]